MSASVSTAVAPNYGIDADRVLSIDDPIRWLKRRLDGRYAVDEFGGDPHLMDLLAPLPATAIRVEVEHADRLPRSGGALLVSNRGIGMAEPFVLGLAVRRAASRRLRVVGAPDLPLVGPLVQKLGGIGYSPSDCVAMLRAGHLLAAPLGMTWLRAGAGEPPRPLLGAALGFPVIPIAVRPGGPFGLSVGVWPGAPWRVVVGEPMLAPPGTDVHDQLAAAELAEQVRNAVGDLLEEAA
jgi:1-acyl-sn-glycerol-3-phosphate acyltransferase